MSPKTTHSNPWRILYLATFAEICVIMILRVLWGTDSIDAKSYFIAFDTIMSGHPDIHRTPFYPLLIGFPRLLLGETAGMAAVWLIQIALFLLSVGWFRELALTLIPNRKVAFWMTAIYALYPGPVSLTCFLLTESIALSGMTGLLYLVLRAYKGSDMRAAVGSGIPLAGLVMLRPSMIYLPFVLGLFWLSVALSRHRLKAGLAGLAGCFLAAGLQVAYTVGINREYGIKSPSTVSVWNSYYTIREAGVIVPEEISDPDIRRFAEYILSANPQPPALPGITDEAFMLFGISTPEKIEEFIHEAVARHPGEMAVYLLRKRLPDVCASDAIYGGAGVMLMPVRAITGYVSVNVGATYLIFICFMAMLIRHGRREFNITHFHWLMAGLFMAANVIVILGAQYEWSRLLIPCYPVLLLITGICLTALVRSANFFVKSRKSGGEI